MQWYIWQIIQLTRHSATRRRPNTT